MAFGDIMDGFTGRYLRFWVRHDIVKRYLRVELITNNSHNRREGDNVSILPTTRNLSCIQLNISMHDHSKDF